MSEISDMRVVLVGGGGREHALARALCRSARRVELHAAPGNPGIDKLAAVAVAVDMNDHAALADYCRAQAIDLVVVGPEQPLAEGMADVLRAAGIAVFGPSKAAAQLEASKKFSKEFMHRHGVPTAAYRVFDSTQSADAREYLSTLKGKVVLKADGLAAGKGVVICDDADAAAAEIEEFFTGRFGDAGATVVVEDFLVGQEASVFAICDGENYITLAAAQDHKRAFDDDKGPNTGGMGAYAPAPVVTDEVMRRVCERVIEPVLQGMRAEGMPFVGCLFCGLMIDDAGEVSVVEFNVRLGDPEAQVVLDLVEGDAARLLLSAARGALDTTAITSVANGFRCCVVLASGGYPGSYSKGHVIEGLENLDDSQVYHAGTKVDAEGALVTNGGRVLAICGQAATVEDAVAGAYEALHKVHFENMMYRRDIARRALG